MKKKTVTVMISVLPNKRNILDALVVFGILLALIPVRLLFVELVHDSWLGSFGIITLVMTVIMYLTYKEKLGYVGDCILRYFTKKHKKKKIIFTIQFVIAIYMLGNFVYAVNYVDEDPKFNQTKMEILALVPNAQIDTQEKLTNKAIEQIEEKPEAFLMAILVYAYMMVYNYDVFALILWTINDISDGFYLNMATIFLVEEIEIFGLMLFNTTFIRNIFNKKAQT